MYTFLSISDGPVKNRGQYRRGWISACRARDSVKEQGLRPEGIEEKTS
jgi:hypothetical protein